MPAIDPHSFLDVLAAYLAGKLSIKFAETPRALWTGPADEDLVPKDDKGRPGVYTELRAYDGSIDPAIGLPTVPVQARTVGHYGGQVRARAVELANALLHGHGRPLVRLDLPTAAPTFRLLAVRDLRGPAYLERDEKGREVWTVNFGAEYLALAAG